MKRRGLKGVDQDIAANGQAIRLLTPLEVEYLSADYNVILPPRFAIVE